MHIVITRPKEESLNLIDRLIKIGHSVTHLPVIKIEKLETQKINLEKFNLKIKCFCVGRSTELTAKQAGFINTYSSEGTVDSLIELIVRTIDNKSGKLLYWSSEFISKDLDLDLINEGYFVDRISNYTSFPVEHIDKKTLEFIKNNPPDVFFIYSVKSAKNLFNLINKYSLLNIVTHSNLMCISEKVLLVLKEIKWKKVFIFTPGEEEFTLNKIK